METLRVFVRWLEGVDGVEQGLSQKVLSPEITPDENSLDVMMDSDQASSVLSQMEQRRDYLDAEGKSVVFLICAVSKSAYSEV